MPVFQRKVLRREVGVVRMRECTIGTTHLAVSLNQPVAAMDSVQANTDLSGQNLYQRAWLRVASTDYRVGSFNFQSGAWLSAQTAQQLITAAMDFEVHERISPSELDLCLDEVIKGLRVEQEVGIPTVDGAMYYTLDAAASPNTIIDIGNVYVFGDPSNSLNRNRQDLVNFSIVNTATGRELRLGTALGGSQQIVLDALIELTLGLDDAASITLLNSDWITWGAAAQAYHMLIQRAPGTDAALLEKRRAEAARMFTKLSARRQASMQRRLGFDARLAGEGRTNPVLLTDF